VITTYTYDGLNRPYQVSYNVGATGVPATSTVTYTYGTSSASNNNGRLLTVADGSNTETYSYDLLGQVTQAQKLISGTTYTVGYAYNLAGELTSITYPSGRVVQQNYDAIGRLTTILSGATNYASGFAYNPAGQVTGFNYGNGVTAAYGYTPERLLLQTLSYTKPGQTLFSLSYGYTHPNGGKNGQITNITDNLDSGRTANYTYDALYRVSTAVTTGSAGYPQWGLSWTYDRYGNRTNQTVTAGSAPANSLAISATTNRITSTGFTYDANGNLTQEGSASFQYKYDGENRLASFNNGTATYTYVGAQRVKKVSGSTTTVYVFSGSKVIAEYVNGAAVGSPTREYVYAGGNLLATYEGATLKYHQQDHLSVRLTTDASGNILAGQGHYPFGEQWYAGAGSTKWQFTSYERDAESGLDQAVFRYDSTRVGRFTSPDPLAGSIGDPQSLNRYTYVANNPVSLVDPLGLDYCTDHHLPPDICVEVTGSAPEVNFIDASMSSDNFFDRTAGLGGIFRNWFFYSGVTGGGGRTPPSPHPPGPPKSINCAGNARVLAGNPNMIGQPGGLGGSSAGDILVRANSAAVFVSQFGGSRTALRGARDQFSGTAQLPGGAVSFQGISETIGSDSSSGQQNLAGWRKAGVLVIELPSLPAGADKGDPVPVTLAVPFGFNCPTGTTITGVNFGP
jgi:RHS repeat-associated protein